MPGDERAEGHCPRAGAQGGTLRGPVRGESADRRPAHRSPMMAHG